MHPDEKIVKSKNKIFFDYFVIIVTALILSMIIRTFVIETVLVSGDSMLNTIESGDRIISSKLSSAKNGDIVLVKEGDIILIKRLIASSGDTIEIKDDEVILNGNEIEEKYLLEEMDTADIEEIELKEGQMFVMGDNRNNSSDSRYYGIFESDDYIGKAVLGLESWYKFYIPKSHFQ